LIKSRLCNLVEQGVVRDGRRINFLQRYIGQVRRAISEGADVRGYYHRMSTDNFEWAEGYQHWWEEWRRV
jgi:beta-glucosidase